MDSTLQHRHMGKTFKGDDLAKILEQVLDYLNSLPDYEVRAMTQSVNANAVRHAHQVMVILERRTA